MQINKEIVSTFEERTKASCELDKKAKKSMPGGDTRWSTYYLPYPAYMEDGEGCTLTDVDGNQYIDFVNNFTSLVHGHRNEKIQQAVEKAIKKPVIFGSPRQNQYELAELLVERMPGIERLRYTNSGTEATMMAMRTARSYKKRDIIIKMDGGYHGSHEFAEVNITPDLSGAAIPVAKTEGAGIPDCVLDSVKVARYNDLDSVEALLEEFDGRVAGIILEPMMNAGGIISAETAFLRGLRKLADRYDVLLIFDEIVTFRMSTGGLQKLTGVIPDMTVLGKIIGGGFAIGAFGGKKEIMDLYDPVNPSGYHHSGTFNGHNVTMEAGIAAVKLLDEKAIEHINALGAHMEAEILQAYKEVGIANGITRTGSLMQIHWTDKPIKEGKDMLEWKKNMGDVPRLFHLELLNRGVFATTRGMFNISTPMQISDIDRTVRIIKDILVYMKPYIKEKAPNLVK